MSAYTKELVSDAHAGDYTAFETVYNKYFSIIYNFCFSLIRQGEEAEDITTETFVKLYKLYDRFGGSEANIRGFLYITSRNACMDYFRFQKKNEYLKAVIKGQLEAEEYLNLNDQLNGMYYQAVQKAIEKLPERQKTVIKKLYQEEKDHQTVAEEMNVELNTVYSLRSRAISLLRELVFKRNITEGVLFLFILYLLLSNY